MCFSVVMAEKVQSKSDGGRSSEEFAGEKRSWGRMTQGPSRYFWWTKYKISSEEVEDIQNSSPGSSFLEDKMKELRKQLKNRSVLV